MNIDFDFSFLCPLCGEYYDTGFNCGCGVGRVSFASSPAPEITVTPIVDNPQLTAIEEKLDILIELLEAIKLRL